MTFEQLQTLRKIGKVLKEFCNGQLQIWSMGYCVKSNMFLWLISLGFIYK